MPNYKITLQRFVFKGQNTPADSIVVIYKDKNTAKAAQEYAETQAVELFGEVNGQGKVLYLIEEVPAV